MLAIVNVSTIFSLCYNEKFRCEISKIRNVCTRSLNYPFFLDGIENGTKLYAKLQQQSTKIQSILSNEKSPSFPPPLIYKEKFDANRFISWPSPWQSNGKLGWPRFEDGHQTVFDKLEGDGKFRVLVQTCQVKFISAGQSIF